MTVEVVPSGKDVQISINGTILKSPFEHGKSAMRQPLPSEKILKNFVPTLIRTADARNDYLDQRSANKLAKAAKADKAFRKENHLHVVSIEGMDEAAMMSWWNSIDVNDDNFFKGTRFMGVDKSSFSLVARCLKVGIPSALEMKVKIGVKFSWTQKDVMLYAEEIRDQMYGRGVFQPDGDLKKLHPEWFSKK